MDKTGIVVQARNGSKRLPNKMIMDLEGKTLFEHIIERLMYTKFKDEVILATTTKERDDILIELSKKLGIYHFRGSENDVLERFLGTTKQYNLDLIVRVCADNPFIDPEGLDMLVDYRNNINADHVDSYHEKGWPSGSGSEVITREALFKIDKLTKDLKYRENVTLFARDPDNAHLFKTGHLDASLEILRPDLKLSVDTLDELEAVRKIYKSLYKPGKIIPLRDMIGFLDKNPDIMSNVKERGLHSYDLKPYLKN